MANIEFKIDHDIIIDLDMGELDNLIKVLQELQAQIKLTRTDCLLNSFTLNDNTDLIFKIIK